MRSCRPPPHHYRRKLRLCLTLLLWVVASVIFSSPKSSFSNLQALKSGPSNVRSPLKIPRASSATLVDHGVLSNGASGIIWWLHITDTQDVWYNASKKAWFRDFLNDTARVIAPACILNTGDLCNDDTQGFFGGDPGQKTADWQAYAQLLQETEMNDTYYYDLMGNHDGYSDPGFTQFLTNSMQKRLYYNFTITTPFGKYAFIGLHTQEDNGIKYPFEFFGHLNQTELDWYEDCLSGNEDANVTIAFGHMPAYEIFEGFDRFLALNRQYGVDLYLVGHGHENVWERVDNRMVSWETAMLGDFADSYRIFAIDQNGIATSVQSKDAWPVGVITSPVDWRNVYGDYNATQLASPGEVHVLVWDPQGIQSVEWRATVQGDAQDSWSTWQPMVAQGGPLYAAAWDSQLANGETHLVQTRIRNTLGQEKVEQIEYQSTLKFSFGWWFTRPLIAIVVVGALITLLPLKSLLRRKHRLPPKRAEQRVDPQVRKYMLVKLIAIFLIPLTFAAIWPNEIVAIFTLFYWRSAGTFVSGFNWLYSLASWVFGLIFPLLNLSPRRRYRMLLLAMPGSVGASFFMLSYYTMTLGLLSLIAPGYYLGFICDALIIKREVSIIRRTRTRKQPNS